VPAIEPVRWENLDPVLREELHARIEGRSLSSTLPVQVWAHVPAAATAWVRLLAELQECSRLEERLRELVRLRIAAFTQCRTCATGRKSDAVTEEEISCLVSDDSRFTAREQAALRYAEAWSVDHLTIGDENYRDLAPHFSVPEIVELQMFCALMLAGGRLAYVQRAWEDDDQPTLLQVDQVEA
jgi:AhpD family alkylhydroperoxidase